MPIPSPNLDDRSFAQLLEQARLAALQKAPGWSDQSPSDPGIVLLEAFAYLTETMLYRLNRIPDKAYHEFLRARQGRRHPIRDSARYASDAGQGRWGRAAVRVPHDRAGDDRSRRISR